MVEIPDIRDRDTLEAWLETQPPEVAVWIASRASARVMPQWWDAVLTEDWAQKRELTALPVLRSNLISSVAALVPTDDIERAARAATATASAAARFGSTYGTGTYGTGAFTAVNASDAVAAAKAAAAASAAANAAHAAYAAYAAADATDLADRASSSDDAFRKAIRADAEEAGAGRLPNALPLWPDGAEPLASQWVRSKAQLAKSSDLPDWQFWIEWYDAQLSGRTMLPDPKRTWDMLEQIALIAPEIWDAGPETVNPIIREVWKLHRLRSEVAALQAEKDASLATRASQTQRSHNQPPEGLVDDEPELAQQITIVGDSLDDARNELEQDTPDKALLRKIAERLLSALGAIVNYCGKVADAAVMSAAKVGGGAGGAALLDYFANNGRLMQFARDLFTYAFG